MIIFVILGLFVFGFPVLCFIAGLMGIDNKK